MILRFNKDCPSNLNPKKIYKAGRRVVMDREIGQYFVNSGYADEVNSLNEEIIIRDGNNKSRVR